ncbi:MAG: family 20 glycosylhydrolase [Candidatus Pseudobacter hemicellulosilyticus]|uniref:beta-N-acetylhexosaminidase n=1 Tax=Candidatus Pseudobacter hemicellulosilyticus TaxID=3121375 RepID=A0AAJ5WX02_9BACT|nr:MAG: family 20 glycosylhydrolase [Pseudobacter sp.]
MYRILLLALCCWLAVPAAAQSKRIAVDPATIRVDWEVITNHHEGKAACLSAFTFTNTGKKALPASGWAFYFNFVRTIDPAAVTGGVQVRLVNGDLYKMSPATGFAGLAPGATLRVELVAGAWLVNQSDAPLGLFWVLDEQPEKAIAVKQYQVKPSTEPAQTMRSMADQLPLAGAAALYQQYAALSAAPVTAQPLIIPSPAVYQANPGSFFISPATTTIVYDSSFAVEAGYLANELSRVLGKKLPLSAQPVSSPAIELVKNEAGPEAYTLSVTPQGVRILAGSNAGIFYGIQSLKALLPPAAWSAPAVSVRVPCAAVQDQPRFGYRSFLLDVARHFQPKAQLLKTLDLLSFYKINVFHLHFSEDEGWRVEIPGLPELTQIGGRRGFPFDGNRQLPPSFGSGPDADHSRGSGFYSREDFVEILRYATERHIRVIPEIETPGHARAAIIAMKARYDRLLKEGKEAEAREFMLHDPADQSVYRSVQGWDDNVINVALPSTYRFLEKVVDGLRDMYREANAPLTQVHMGGDEVPAGVWERSPVCQALLQQGSALTTTDDLWYYYYGKVYTLLKERGLGLYGWEEAGMRKTRLDGRPHMIPNPDFANNSFQLDVWNNVLGWGAEDLAYRLANAGYQVVLSPVSNLYFDMAYQKAFDEPGYYWGGFADEYKPWSFIPFDYYRNSRTDVMGNPLDNSFYKGKDRLTDYGRKNTVGLQGLLWSETIISEQRMEYMILPKLMGLAERAWAADPAWATEPDPATAARLTATGWGQFTAMLGQRELPRLDHYAGGFHYRIPPPGLLAENGKVLANVQYKNLQVRYTTDGTEPTGKSRLYTGPVDNTGKLQFKAFNATGRSSRTVQPDTAGNGTQKRGF